ncbi:MAG: hypothetical protein KC502_07400 [Myxococcales bacterium]|nr:hypothetical protein [Myxococcales bacterium]
MTQHAASLLFALCLLSTCTLGCIAEGPDAAPEVDAGPWMGPASPTTLDFLVTSMSFAVPEGIQASSKTVANPCGVKKGTDNTLYEPLVLDGLKIDGFDLDGTDTQGDGICPHTDYVSPSGTKGVDYGFLHVMDMIRPVRPGQTVEVVLKSAPAQGLMRIGLRLKGVDDLLEDDDVSVQIVTTAETPLLGADGQILAGSSVAVDPDPAFHSTLPGRIEGGVLHAGPGDVTMGKINLLVATDRVIAFKNVRIRAALKARPTGGYEADAIIAGWWERESMSQAIGKAILAIGANQGELQCVLDKYADHSLDGKTCNAMSTILRAKAVSGFITGLPDGAGEP